MTETDLKKIGKYEISAEIGRGAMGNVYKARDPLIGRMVALKVITGGLTDKPDLLERFYQEARSAGALQHPNIVTVYELGKEGDLPFIAMEYLGGESLEKMVARQAPLPLARKVGYIVQICRALDYAHQNGVVHRDIKPGNVMGAADGTVKVVDFGIARLVDASKTQTGTLIGTLGYMSPQQLRGEHADERSDIWAVGVLFYELLKYKRPFEGDNPAAMVMNIISQQPPPLMESGVECTAEIEAVISRMLQKEAIDRYQTMEEVLLDLEPQWRQLQHGRVSELVAESQKLVETNDLKKAQRLLREALHADSSHLQAKTLLDKVSRELRRQQVLPRVNEQLAKAREKLQAGQFREAKADVQAALHLDSTFQAARDMLGEVEVALQRSREVEKILRGTKRSIAEGALTDADRRLDDVLSLDSQNKQAQELRRQIRDEVSRRERRERLSEAVRHARDLWSQLRYGDCIEELLALQKEFPGNTEIETLLETARRDQVDAEKDKKLAVARNLLAARQYEQARTVLAVLQKDFPDDPAVRDLLKLATAEERTAAQQQRLQQELTSLRSLAGEGQHEEALRRGEELLKEFPEEFELVEFVNYVRSEHKRADRESRLGDAIRQTRELIGEESFGEAVYIAGKALAEFPGSGELAGLRDEARNKQQEKQRQEQLDKRIDEVKAMITRNELTGAIELARETIATLGVDRDISHLLETATSERTRRQKEKGQDQKLTEAQNLLAAGDLGEATRVLDQALATQVLDASDPRVSRFLAEVEKRKAETGFSVPPDAARTAPSEAARGEQSQPAAESSATMFSHASRQIMEEKPTASPLDGPPSGARGTASGEMSPETPVKQFAGKKPFAIAAAGIAIAIAIGAGIYLRTGRKAALAVRTSRQETPVPKAMNQPPQPIQAAPNAPGKENALWNQAVAAFKLDDLNQAEREFRQIETMGPGTHQAGAHTYVVRLIPRAREADRLFKQGQLLESRSYNPQNLQLARHDFQRVIELGGPLAKAAARLQAGLTTRIDAEFSQLVKEYNAGTDDVSALRKLQAQFRALEKSGGALGSESRVYAEQRIPARLKNMAHPAAKSASAAPAKQFSWVAKVGRGQGVKLINHPLPIAVVAQAAASHDQFELRLTVDRKGHVVSGRVISGNPSLGQAVVSEAENSWRFSRPSQNTSVLVSVEF